MFKNFIQRKIINFLKIFYLSLFFFILFRPLNSHQGPPEKLFKVSENLLPKNKKSIKIAKNKNNKKIVKEIRETGDKSHVYIINDFLQFLTITSKFPSKPMIIKIYDSTKNPKNMFQELADKYNEKAVFLSLDALKNPKLLNFLMNIILVERQVVPVNGSIDLPIFLFCYPNCIKFVGFQLTFKAHSLHVLAKPGEMDKNILSENLEKMLKK
ncbi:MAG: hypothetical protein WC436_02195 [Candidatus Babeliales bacterium]